MNDPATDDLAREHATDPRRSVLLQAPAGSGKTTVLTERLLRLLAEVDEPEQVLAITFTRKAAAEMRARVLKAMRGEIAGTGRQPERMRDLARLALERDALRGWHLLDNPNRLRIQTIDSFNFWLASQLPVAAGAGGNLAVADRPQESYRSAARETLVAGEREPSLAADVELLFERLDNSWSRVERLLSEMLEKRGHWLRYVLAHDGTGLCARIEQSVREVIRDRLQAACTDIEAGLRELAGRVSGVGLLGGDLEHLAAWQALAKAALTQKGDWRKPRGVTKSLGPAYERESVKEDLRECIEHWSGTDRALEHLREIACLPEPDLSEDDARALQGLSRVLRFGAIQLQTQFSIDARVDHTYISGAARAALTENGEPTDLALRAGLSLRHILVDEFQDTSIAQFDLLEALTVGWEEGDGRTLFVVGDPMQSIYQFREAEVGLFLRARNHGIGTVRLEPLQLTRNFRSAPEVIEWINRTFARLFPDRDDLRASAVAFTSSITGRTGGRGAVELRQFDAADRESEARAIAQRIEDLRRFNTEATIAVLVASRPHAVPVFAALHARHIEAVGVDLVPLGELSVVRDLVALLRALHHLGDRLSWLTVLRAPWCGVTLVSLSELSRRGDSLLLLESMQNDERLQRCGEADRARIGRIVPVLIDALATRDLRPLAEWLETIWLRLGAADAYTIDDLRHARAFFIALGERAESGEWRGPQDIEALLGELYAQPIAHAANPVQIMTIHRAKGLEFDHVFVPSLDRQLNRGAEPLLRWLDLPRERGPSDLLMAPVPNIGEEEGGRLGAYLKRLIAARLRNERTRLMYVAATRAKQTLFLSAAPKQRADGTTSPLCGTLLAAVWSALADEFEPGEQEVGVEPVAVNAATVQVLQRLPADWAAAPLPPVPAVKRLPLVHQSLGEVEFSWAGETVRHVGTVVHGALEQFALLQDLPSPEAVRDAAALYRQQLHRLGVPDDELLNATRIVLDALQGTLADPQGRWIFSREHREACSELALTGIASGRLTNAIIDRSFVDAAGTRWVIDFKTSRHEGGDLGAFLLREVERYRPQLDTYVALARALGPEPVRAALYFPLLGTLREL